MTQDEKKTIKKKGKALGRGLAALLGDDETLLENGQPDKPKPGEKVLELPLESLEPNPYQPRRSYNTDALRSLADSIKEYGLLQPLVVRPVENGYQLIAGERRMRACQLAGITMAPVVIRQATDEQALLLALLENLQREDLNPLEEARAYQRLASEFSLNQEEIAQGVGKDRTTVTNALRLLKLPRTIQDDLAGGHLSAGHARTLLALTSEAQMRQVRDMIIKKGLSVRATEQLVKTMNQKPKEPSPPTEAETYIKSLSEELSTSLGTKVQIQRKGKKGRIVLEFYSDQDLERLLDNLR
ncbi:ParB/RepB/Spo0J family partition protein [Dethiosulfatarculus sandiegensis]|uniref:Plasmid stablization protein ParB n=1 Tax=Dethiosulfatarculus sandiegensis TaxID=1429043 RepID=A0A0D2IZ59_9BACT|nr:ParB/RepB/Spo0J family partition protein [Dethiosulfatarculus sandiegensis]KIX11309.1 plasmid stablization protein ParB [Dethiosulfatarculus sandiegensis]